MAGRIATAMGITKGLSKAIGNEAAYQSLIEASNLIGEQQQALFRNILIENTNSKRKIEELQELIITLREQINSLGIEKENYWTLAEVINADLRTRERDARSFKELRTTVRESTTILDHANILTLLNKIDKEYTKQKETRSKERMATTAKLRSYLEDPDQPKTAKKGGYRMRKTHRRRR
jgi:hypothetical protein